MDKDNLSLRITKIGQAHLDIGYERWKQVLIQATGKDAGIQRLLADQKCQTIFDRPLEGWAKEANSRYPWYRWDSKAGAWFPVVSLATVERIEVELGEVSRV